MRERWYYCGATISVFKTLLLKFSLFLSCRESMFKKKRWILKLRLNLTKCIKLNIKFPLSVSFLFLQKLRCYKKMLQYSFCVHTYLLTYYNRRDHQRILPKTCGIHSERGFLKLNWTISFFFGWGLYVRLYNYLYTLSNIKATSLFLRWHTIEIIWCTIHTIILILPYCN